MRAHDPPRSRPRGYGGSVHFGNGTEAGVSPDDSDVRRSGRRSDIYASSNYRSFVYLVLPPLGAEGMGRNGFSTKADPTGDEAPGEKRKDDQARALARPGGHAYYLPISLGILTS